LIADFIRNFRIWMLCGVFIDLTLGQILMVRTFVNH